VGSGEWVLEIVDGMKNYLKTVTLGAFTWNDGKRIGLLVECIKKTGGLWLLLHFVLITLCLNFPVMLSMAKLPPYELFTRLYGNVSAAGLPEQIRNALAENGGAGNISADDFNTLMTESGYGAKMLMPLLGMALGVIAVIQAAFYLCAVVFLKISRMNTAPLSFRNSLGLALFSSTLPVLAAALIGLFIPAVHIIVYYLAVIIIIFQRSKLCPDG